jgi:hypothetical protein
VFSTTYIAVSTFAGSVLGALREIKNGKMYKGAYFADWVLDSDGV